MGRGIVAGAGAAEGIGIEDAVAIAVESGEATVVGTAGQIGRRRSAETAPRELTRCVSKRSPARRLSA